MVGDRIPLPLRIGQFERQQRRTKVGCEFVHHLPDPGNVVVG